MTGSTGLDSGAFGAVLDLLGDACAAEAVPGEATAAFVAVETALAQYRDGTGPDRAASRGLLETVLYFARTSHELSRHVVDATRVSTRGLDPHPDRCAARMPIVRGRCPACGLASLFLGEGGHVTCAALRCAAPDAADGLAPTPDESETA